MPDRRKGAPGSFGAPLDELLPSFGLSDQRPPVSIDVHRRPPPVDDQGEAQQGCRIFLLNQRLYEAAQPQR